MRISDWSSDVCSSDLFCLDKETPSFDSLCAVERFAVNVLRAEQHALSVRFSPAGADKWDTVDHDLWAGGLPVLRGCLASFACRRTEESGVGNGCVRTCRYRWSPYH